MTPAAFLLAVVALVAIAIAYIALHQLDQRNDENLELRAAFDAESIAHDQTRTELLIANVDRRYYRVAYDHQTVQRMEMELAGRMLPSLDDADDLAVPSWPMGSAPMFDSLPNAAEVDALILAHIAEQVA